MHRPETVHALRVRVSPAQDSSLAQDSNLAVCLNPALCINPVAVCRRCLS
jgi:hypothetical protein